MFEIDRPQISDSIIVLGGIGVGQKILGGWGAVIGCVFAILLLWPIKTVDKEKANKCLLQDNS